MPRILLAIFLLATLGGCDLYYESRVKGALVDAGLSPPMAECMAERLVDRLSREQLESLKRLGALRKDDGGDVSSRELLGRYRGAIDPQVYRVLARSGISCALSV